MILSIVGLLPRLPIQKLAATHRAINPLLDVVIIAIEMEAGCVLNATLPTIKIGLEYSMFKLRLVLIIYSD